MVDHNMSDIFTGPPEKLPPWISEYSDSIGRTGQVIIDQKLLYPKSKKNRF